MAKCLPTNTHVWHGCGHKSGYDFKWYLKQPKGPKRFRSPRNGIITITLVSKIMASWHLARVAIQLVDFVPLSTSLCPMFSIYNLWVTIGSYMYTIHTYIYIYISHRVIQYTHIYIYIIDIHMIHMLDTRYYVFYCILYYIHNISVYIIYVYNIYTVSPS